MKKKKLKHISYEYGKFHLDLYILILSNKQIRYFIHNIMGFRKVKKMTMRQKLSKMG